MKQSDLKKSVRQWYYAGVEPVLGQLPRLYSSDIFTEDAPHVKVRFAFVVAAASVYQRAGNWVVPGPAASKLMTTLGFAPIEQSADGFSYGRAIPGGSSVVVTFPLLGVKDAMEESACTVLLRLRLSFDASLPAEERNDRHLSVADLSVLAALSPIVESVHQFANLSAEVSMDHVVKVDGDIMTLAQKLAMKGRAFSQEDVKDLIANLQMMPCRDEDGRQTFLGVDRQGNLVCVPFFICKGMVCPISVFLFNDTETAQRKRAYFEKRGASFANSSRAEERRRK